MLRVLDLEVFSKISSLGKFLFSFGKNVVFRKISGFLRVLELEVFSQISSLGKFLYFLQKRKQKGIWKVSRFVGFGLPFCGEKSPVLRVFLAFFVLKAPGSPPFPSKADSRQQKTEENSRKIKNFKNLCV